MPRVFAILVIAAMLAACARNSGSTTLPSSKRGWGIVVIVVGAAWIVTGAAIAANSDLSAGKRAGYTAGAVSVGTLLIYGGYRLAR